MLIRSLQMGGTFSLQWCHCREKSEIACSVRLFIGIVKKPPKKTNCVWICDTLRPCSCVQTPSNSDFCIIGSPFKARGATFISHKIERYTANIKTKINIYKWIQKEKCVDCSNCYVQDGMQTFCFHLNSGHFNNVKQRATRVKCTTMHLIIQKMYY